jgi:membrane fusion protein (multidrug efflux system)
VQVGEWAGDAWVISDGLQAGERVVVDGVLKIGPGVPVKVAQALAQTNGGPGSAAAPPAGDAKNGRP